MPQLHEGYEVVLRLSSYWPRLQLVRRVLGVRQMAEGLPVLLGLPLLDQRLQDLMYMARALDGFGFELSMQGCQRGRLFNAFELVSYMSKNIH